jgi:hypothetical protein
MIAWLPALWAILKPILVGLFTQLLVGRTLKHILYWPLRAWARWTKNKKDDQVVTDVAHDWDLEQEKESGNEDGK